MNNAELGFLILSVIGLVAQMGVSIRPANPHGGRTMRRHQRGGKSKKHRKH